MVNAEFCLCLHMHVTGSKLICMYKLLEIFHICYFLLVQLTRKTLCMLEISVTDTFPFWSNMHVHIYVTLWCMCMWVFVNPAHVFSSCRRKVISWPVHIVLKESSTMRTVQYQGESEGVCGQGGLEHLCLCVWEDLFEYGQFKFVGVGLGVCVRKSGGVHITRF